MTPTDVEERVREIRGMREAGARGEVLDVLVRQLFADVLRCISASGRKTTSTALAKAALRVLGEMG